MIVVMTAVPAFAGTVPKEHTPDYKVSFYAFDCYNMQDDNGKRSGYGYEMMQGLSRYMQCTFSYVGYDKTAEDCVDMLRDGDIDIYTAAKATDERREEFAISTHPAITASTCMNVKVGNDSVIPGDYSTYNGLRIGLLKRHTYNESFLAWAKSKGFDCDIFYYDTPTELSKALVDGEVDALVNSYMRIPDDEKTIENFGDTPYYLMARKEDQGLIDELDEAIDSMNVATPNWRTELYNRYYGSQDLNTDYTDEEAALLDELHADNAVIRAVMNPDNAPYSWYEDGEARGIAADLFRFTADRLGLAYDIIPVSTRQEYKNLVDGGAVDIWMDADSYYAYDADDAKYRLTDPYITTSISLLRERGASQGIKRLSLTDDSLAAKEIINATWTDVNIENAPDNSQSISKVLNGSVDGAIMKTYTAQKLARDDVQNRLRVDIVPGASLDMCMGINADDDVRFYGLWQKTLMQVASGKSTETVQSYIDETTTPSMIEAIFDHPTALIVIVVSAVGVVFLIILYLISVRNNRKQKKISEDLQAALLEAEKANEAKQEFFSKMSHDIRTPLNVVLGMTQIAQKYKYDASRLENALDSISTEGNYLLSLINSILDVNQLEHGYAELNNEPFRPADCAREAVELLEPLAGKKNQKLTFSCDCDKRIAVGDGNRLRIIMINIISNAIKYTGEDGHIDVSFKYYDNGYYSFSCEDNGIGMSEEFVRHICDDYVRAEDSRISRVEGTGLGMSVVKGFTDLMGGRLKVTSKLGEGSKFVVDIPFDEASEEQQEAINAKYAEDHELPDIRYSGKKVLLVEDNELNAEIAMELLGSIGLNVDWSENGELALERFEQSDNGYYFAIFMDMQMPVMDGVEATKRIRACGREDSDVPIFAMTANTFSGDKKRCIDAGMTGYIPKPISIKSIEGQLDKGIPSRQ